MLERGKTVHDLDRVATGISNNQLRISGSDKDVQLLEERRGEKRRLTLLPLTAFVRQKCHMNRRGIKRGRSFGSL